MAGLGSAVVWSVVARAQKSGVPLVGLLAAGSSNDVSVSAFRKGLSEAGYVEGRNVAIDFRFANGLDQMPAMLADLIHRRVIVIATIGGPAPALAAKAATTTIPIIFGSGGDPVQLGLVASLNRPGGNVTGVSSMMVELMPKRFELLQELIPQATRFAVLVNHRGPNAAHIASGVESAAAAGGRQIDFFEASTSREIETAFASLVQKQTEALLLGPDPLFYSRRVQVTTLAARYTVPSIYWERDFVEVGGLMSYGTSLTFVYHQVGLYAGRVLKGEKPSDLPVMQPTEFELVVNQATARIIGVEVPRTLLAVADEVIE
jgi:putative tryptophan/tyrosine transport system substrate-binding protein